MRGLAAIWVMLTSGCVLVDAPETLEELVVFGFTHFEDDEAFLRATGDNMLPLAEEVLDELRDGYYVDLLDNEDLEAAGVDAPDVSGILGALGAADYRHSVQDVIWLGTREDRADLWDNVEDSTLSDRDGDRDCFLSRHCREYSFTVSETTTIPLLGQATSTYRRMFRWVRLSDGQEVIFSRSLNPDGVDLTTNILQVDQQYSFYCLYPAPDEARRLEAFWVDATFLGADLPEAFAVDQTVNEMQTGADRASDLLDELL